MHSIESIANVESFGMESDTPARGFYCRQGLYWRYQSNDQHFVPACGVEAGGCRSWRQVRFALQQARRSSASTTGGQ